MVEDYVEDYNSSYRMIIYWTQCPHALNTVTFFLNPPWITILTYIQEIGTKVLSHKYMGTSKEPRYRRSESCKIVLLVAIGDIGWIE